MKGYITYIKLLIRNYFTSELGTGAGCFCSMHNKSVEQDCLTMRLRKVSRKHKSHASVSATWDLSGIKKELIKKKKN